MAVGHFRLRTPPLFHGTPHAKQPQSSLYGTSPCSRSVILRIVNAADGASRGVQPLSELRSLRSDSLSPGSTPCPCPGVDRSSRGWLPETTEHMTIHKYMRILARAIQVRWGTSRPEDAIRRPKADRSHTPFRAPASSGGPGGTPHGG